MNWSVYFKNLVSQPLGKINSQVNFSICSIFILFSKEIIYYLNKYLEILPKLVVFCKSRLKYKMQFRAHSLPLQLVLNIFNESS